MKVKAIAIAAALLVPTGLFAQKYQGGLVDKTVATVGNEVILLSDIEGQVQQLRAQGRSSDRDMRCNILEDMMESKIFLMQARIDSLTVNSDMVESELSNRIDTYRTYLGGDEEMEKTFGKPLYRLRQEWRQMFEDMSLTQQEQGTIAAAIPEVTPYDVQQYLDTVAVEDLPVVPIKYQLSQICIYPDREAANLAVKERLLSIRERVINGEKFSTLARIYSEDPGSARRGGELGMASKSIFWPVFSDAAMALRPGTISQIVETPDGFHIIEVIEKKGDKSNILLPKEILENGKPYKGSKFPKAALQITWQNAADTLTIDMSKPRQKFSMLENFDGWLAKKATKVMLGGEIFFWRGRSKATDGYVYDWSITGF